MACKRMVLAVLVVGLSAVAGVGLYKHYRWKRFDVVVAGRIYRSGQLRPEQLAAAIDKLNLRTVICLNSESAATEAEICRQAHVAFHGFVMPSDGQGHPEDYLEVLKLLRDPARQPVLVHCSAGVARTGVSIALYRMVEEGWSFEQAVAELRSYEKRGRIEPALRDHLARLREEAAVRLSDRRR